MTPIEGVSDIVRLPRLGKIRLGIKLESASHKTYPKAVDYFVSPPEVQEVFGEKPRELEIMFPVEEEEVFAPQYYNCYSMTRGLVCWGTGRTCVRHVDAATGDLANRDSQAVEMREMSCSGEDCPEYQRKQCRRVLRLQFFLPKVPGLGIWELDTSSFYSIVNVNSCLKLIRAACGRVRMLPLVLTLGPREVTPEGKKKTVYILSVTSKATLAEMLAVAAQPILRVLMPPPDTERPEDLVPDEALEQADSSRPAIPEPAQPAGPVAGPSPAPEAPRERAQPAAGGELFPDRPPSPSPGSLEQARQLWLEICRMRRESGATYEQIQKWAEKKGLTVSVYELAMAEEKGEPPAWLTVELLKRLHLSISQYQPKLAEHKRENGQPAGVREETPPDC